MKGATYDNNISLTSFFFSVLGSNAAATCKLTLLQNETDNLKTTQGKTISRQNNTTLSQDTTRQDNTISRQYETRRDEARQAERKEDKKTRTRTTQDST